MRKYMLVHVFGSEQPAKVDEQHFWDASKYKWCLHSSGYVVTNIPVSDNGRTKIYLASLVLNLIHSDDQQIIYLNDDKLDCRESNLLSTNKSIIGSRTPIPSHNTSGFKGVFWHKVARKWCAMVTVKQRQIRIGLFMDKFDAARAYDLALIKYFGPLAKTNESLGAFEKNKI